MGDLNEMYLLRPRGNSHIMLIKTPGRIDGSRRQPSPGKGIIMSVVRTVNNWISYRRAINELGRLNGRALQDLGITRDEIPAVVRASIR
jgi:uncharacterized protein YjiS (DUF1127 family)